MNRAVGDSILVLRRAMDLTQEDLAGRLGITQAALSRYEHDLRVPDDQMLSRLSEELGVTPEFLRHDFRMHGAIGADAHMRRQRTASPADWKRAEARLNAARMHSAYLLERVPLRAQNQVIQVDPEEHTPGEAAMMLRAAWRMPIGAVRNLTRWVESAGVIVLEEDFGTHRIDGVSQWAGDHAIVIVNASLPTDRRRLTIAHELGHLVLHSRFIDRDVEDQANAFAAELLMPEAAIRADLTNLTLGKLSDLKAVWGGVHAGHLRAGVPHGRGQRRRAPGVLPADEQPRLEGERTRERRPRHRAAGAGDVRRSPARGVRAVA